MEGPLIMSSGPAVGLKRKSMSLSRDVLRNRGGLVDVNLSGMEVYTKEERRDLRKKLRSHLERVRDVTFKIAQRQEELNKGSCIVSPESQLQRTPGGVQGHSEYKVVSSTTLDHEPLRPQTQQSFKKSRQPSVLMTSDSSLVTADNVSKDERTTPKSIQLPGKPESSPGKGPVQDQETSESKDGSGDPKPLSQEVEKRGGKVSKAGPGRRSPDVMKRCLELLKKLLNHRHAWVFNEPVDAVKLELHDYHEIITKPMDLGTMNTKFVQGEYKTPFEFSEDARLTFTNAMTYNPEGHFVYKMAEELSDIFEKKWKLVLQKVDEEHSGRMHHSEEAASRSVVEGPVPMDEDVDVKVADKISQPQPPPRGRGRPKGSKTKAKAKVQEGSGRGRPRKLALNNLVPAESDDLGRQRSPQVEVITENGPNVANESCEPEANQEVIQANEAAATLASQVVADVREAEPARAESSSSGSSSTDPGPAPSSSGESQGSQPARQLSPDKLLRVALLRGRFADTILKAQEKTLPVNKNEKDPEKIRRDREELERRQREEKARLQAEAKAAEAARERAELEAANEAKRKREAEREAARRVLQQMERTVEIDENSEILKDLEMLRTASMEQQLSSSGEDSPDSDSPCGLPDFGFQGGNPLERLGLFMKNDEEDEEELAMPAGVSQAMQSNEEMEEGEVD